MTRTRPFAQLAAQVEDDPVRRERIATYKRAMLDALALAELRALRGITPATTLRLEHEEDLYLSTLREYVVELGGELEVNAVFPDGTITLVPAEG